MKLEEIPLTRPINEKVEWAKICYRDFRQCFLGDPLAGTLLKQLKKASEASRNEMAKVGIDHYCGECEALEGGSCCGAGLEDKYSGCLLLINLLLEVQLPEERFDPRGCFFLGPKGCLLIARHVICLNYLCKKITDRIEPLKLKALREKEGMELEYLFLVYERTKKLLRGMKAEAISGVSGLFFSRSPYPT